MLGPPALLLLLAAGGARAAPLPQTGAGERARATGPGSKQRPGRPRRRESEGLRVGRPRGASACEVLPQARGRRLLLAGRSGGEAARAGRRRAGGSDRPFRGLRFGLGTCCPEVLSLHTLLVVLLPFPNVTCRLCFSRILQ